MAQADETAGGAMELGQETESARRRTGWAAAGGILGALGASSCCILPLVRFSLGVGFPSQLVE